VAANVILPLWGKLTAFPKSSAGFEEPLRWGRKEGKEKREGKRKKKRDGRDERKHLTPTPK